MKHLEIEAARVRLGISKREMAEKLGISYNSYCCRERGFTSFKASEIPVLADVLHLTIQQVNDYLFDGKLPVESVAE